MNRRKFLELIGAAPIVFALPTTANNDADAQITPKPPRGVTWPLGVTWLDLDAIGRIYAVHRKLGESDDELRERIYAQLVDVAYGTYQLGKKLS